MNKLTAAEIIEVLKEKLPDHSGYDNILKGFAYEEYDHNELGLGKIVEVEQYGGEGKGDHWYSIKHFVDHDVYLKVTAFYSSYEGITIDSWRDVKEVKPKEKLITEYV